MNATFIRNYTLMMDLYGNFKSHCGTLFESVDYKIYSGRDGKFQRIVITVKSQYDTAHANFLIDDFYLRDFDYFHNTFKNLKYKVLDKFIKW